MSMQISAPAIPMIGQAKLIATIAIATIECPCKNIIMGQMGVILVCSSCKRTWHVSAKMNINLSEVLADASKILADVSKELTNVSDFKS